MSGIAAFKLKNEMLGANFIANFVAAFFVNTVHSLVEAPAPESIATAVRRVDTFFTLFAFITITVINYVYERPIRRAVPLLLNHEAVPSPVLEKARRRLLNEPFALMFLDLSVWMLAAVLYPATIWQMNAGPRFIHQSLFMNLSAGMLTIIVAFFMLEHLLQKRYAPVFFPEGGLINIPGTFRIRIRTRLGALLLASNLIPLIAILHMTYRIRFSPDPPVTTLNQLRTTIAANAVIFIFIGLFLTMLVSRNLAMPFKEIILALKKIKQGRFDGRVKVISNDEIGYTGEAINEMTEGLRERNRLRESLRLAMEVQQNLMPKSDPVIEGLEIAGTSIYCEQTGGDYYDYLVKGGFGKGKVGVIVGDVSDHGIPSALLMTTGRAFLRQRAAMSGAISQIVTDVNREICQDVEESGRFMTLFFGLIDRGKEQLRWVNAGHEPALVYDPRTGRFTELSGGGLPLGVFQDTQYRENAVEIAAGQMVIIGTDGIWESRNAQGEMFGKTRFKEIVRANAHATARQIVNRVIERLEEFCNPLGKDDDITLVIVKIQQL